MNTASDSAEQIVRIYLQGTELALKVTGSITKNTIAMIYAILKDKKQTRGKTTLTKLLKSGKELRIFTIKYDTLKFFQKEAKQYGVLFTALIDKKNINYDGMVDIMIKAEDAQKVNRIIERFELSGIDEKNIKNELEKDRKVQEDKEIHNKVDDNLIDEILGISKEEEVEKENPNIALMDPSPLSEHSLKSNEELDSNLKKPSVRKELEKITEDQKNIKDKINIKNLFKNKESQEKVK